MDELGTDIQVLYPTIFLGPVTDKLKRQQPVGWHWFGKYGIFRQEVEGGRVDTVVLEDGSAYCPECKHDQHQFIPGLLLAMSCRRCGRLDVEHRGTVELPPADVIGQGELFPDVRPPAEPGDVDYCAEHHTTGWSFPDDDFPEPPDGTRLEFVFNTDVYAARRDVKASVDVGWPTASSWAIYPGSIPHTWQCLRRTFGPALRQAIYLYPLSPSTLRLDSTR